MEIAFFGRRCKLTIFLNINNRKKNGFKIIIWSKIWNAKFEIRFNEKVNDSAKVIFKISKFTPPLKMLQVILKKKNMLKILVNLLWDFVVKIKAEDLLDKIQETWGSRCSKEKVGKTHVVQIGIFDIEIEDTIYIYIFCKNEQKEY